VFEKDGVIVAVVDFFFPRFNTVVEFDGMLKYRDDAAEVVIKEKLREDHLRSLGLKVVRIIWNELDEPAEAVVRVLRTMVRGEQLVRG
jgi:very-short-patch-repair endonuclease